MPTTRTRTTTRKPRTSRTKADVENEFNEIQAAAEGAEVMDPQAETLAREHASKTRAAVKDLSVDTIVQKAGTLSLDIGRTIANLTEQCVAKANELKTLQEAVALETAELDRLYDLDVASATIQLLVQEHKDTKAQLEKQIEDVRKAWAEEQAAHTKVIAERNAQTEQARRRESDEYEYTKRTERARKEQEFADRIRLQEQAQQEKVQAIEKNLAERLAVMAKDEAEIAAMRTRIANIDTEISAAAKREVAIATSSLKRELENQHLLATKDLETKLQLSEQRNLSVNSANEKLAEQVATLTKQLDAAKQQVQDIAVKALESSSGQMALNKVMEAQASKENGSTSRKS